MPIFNHIVENVVHLPKTRAKVAAAFLVLSVPIYNPAIDVPRVKQQKVFSQEETFVQPQRGSNTVVLTQYAPAYNPALDVRRRTQAKLFGDPETFISPQGQTVVTALTTYPPTATITFSTRSVVVETTSTFRAQRGSNVVVLSVPGVPPSPPNDLFNSQDVGGWPELLPDWQPQRRPSLVILNSFPVYNPATDVRRGTQAKVFSEPEVFAREAPSYLVTVFQTGYNPATDVTKLKRQQKFFSEPEVFDRRQPRFIASSSGNFIPYDVAHDVRRARMVAYFTDPEAFHRPMPFNQVVINGLVQVSPLEFANGLDIYDDLNGSLLIAWGKFNPTPQSYNVYVNGILNQTVNGLQATISGLVISSYNVSTQVITPSAQIHISVAAVINGLERGQIDKFITPSPTSTELVTPMKRLWPFPNSGLD